MILLSQSDYEFIMECPTSEIAYKYRLGDTYYTMIKDHYGNYTLNISVYGGPERCKKLLMERFYELPPIIDFAIYFRNIINHEIDPDESLKLTKIIYYGYSESGLMFIKNTIEPNKQNFRTFCEDELYTYDLSNRLKKKVIIRYFFQNSNKDESDESNPYIIDIHEHEYVYDKENTQKRYEYLVKKKKSDNGYDLFGEYQLMRTIIIPKYHSSAPSHIEYIQNNGMSGTQYMVKTIKKEVYQPIEAIFNTTSVPKSTYAILNPSDEKIILAKKEKYSNECNLIINIFVTYNVRFHYDDTETHIIIDGKGKYTKNGCLF